MFTRTLAASAAVLVLMTGGAFAQASPPQGMSTDLDCSTLNAMADADKMTAAQDFLDKREGAPMAAARPAGDDPRQSPAQPGETSTEENIAGVGSDQGAGGNGQPASNDSEVRQGVAANANAAADGAPAAPASEGNIAANSTTPPAGADADDAVKAFDGLDAAGLIAGCEAEPDKTFTEITPAAPAAQ